MSLLPFKSHVGILISGATGSGKTTIIWRILQNLQAMFPDDPPVCVLYCYSIHQQLFDEMESKIPNLTTRYGLPSEDDVTELCANDKHNLIILDDLYLDAVESKSIARIFTQGTHHMKLTCLCVFQNLFPRGQWARTIALNAGYLILTANSRGLSQISMLAGQIFPSEKEYLLQAYKDAIQKYGYLVINLTPRADPRLKLVSRIFPGEDPIIYLKGRIVHNHGDRGKTFFY